MKWKLVNSENIYFQKCSVKFRWENPADTQLATGIRA